MNDDWNATRRGASALFTGIIIADSIVKSPFLPSDSLIWGLSFGSGSARKVTFIVEHAWKLPARPEVDSFLITIWDTWTNCSASFALYERFLVVAISGADWARAIDSSAATPGRTRLSPAGASSLWTSKCMGTQPLAMARRALEQLGPGVAIADSGPPSPTR